MSGTNFFTQRLSSAGNVEFVALTDENGLPALVRGTVVPTAGAYAKGCIFIRLDAANDIRAIFENQGTTTAPLFSLISQPSRTVVALADAAATLTAAQMINSGIFTITPTAARTLTTDTAANLIAGFPGFRVGTSFDFTILVLGAFAVTLAGGTGVTIVGSAVGNNSSATFRAVINSPTTVVIYRI